MRQNRLRLQKHEWVVVSFQQKMIPLDKAPPLFECKDLCQGFFFTCRPVDLSALEFPGEKGNLLIAMLMLLLEDCPYSNIGRISRDNELFSIVRVGQDGCRDQKLFQVQECLLLRLIP